MQAPMNEYYTDEEYQYALKQMYRMMERNQINHYKYKQPNGHCNSR